MNLKYKELVRHVLNNGIKSKCRNGKQRIIPSYSFTLDFDKHDPKLSLRKMYYKGVKGEFDTLVDPTPLKHINQFERNGCNYWKEWASADGSLNLDYHNKLHPQLEDIIEQIKTDPNSRRHVIELWDHKSANSGKLSLPCCWHGMTITVIGKALHMTWSQRSVDVMVGLPADIYLSFKFMHHIASRCGLTVGTCMYGLSNVHIYERHVPNAITLLGRTIHDNQNPLKFEVMP